MNIHLPVSTGVFPKEVGFLLKLRQSFLDYKSSGGRVIVNDASPETSIDDDGSVNLYTMSIMVGIVGHGAFINGSMRVCESNYKDVAPNMIGRMIMSEQNNPLKWIIGYGPKETMSVEASSSLLRRSSMCYSRRAPLMVYTNQAVIEAANHSSDSDFWRNLYKPVEHIDRHYTFDGLILDNTVLSMGDMSETTTGPTSSGRSRRTWARSSSRATRRNRRRLVGCACWRLGS